MNLTASKPARAVPRPGWPALLALNLVLAALVWAFHLTDYGFAGAVSELAFPLFVGTIGLLSLVIAARLCSPRARALTRIGAVLSLSGGGFYAVALPLLLAGVVLLPWAFYRMVYAVEEMAAERLIQQTPSPGGRWMALVYFQPVGSNAGYSGHVSVRVAQAGLPLLERRIYYLPVTRVATGEPMDYVHWEDDETLYVPETNELISVGPQRGRLPGFVSTPLGWLMQLRWGLDPEVGAALGQVPLFPDRSPNEGMAYNAQVGALQRWYAVPREHPDRVADWYRAVLAEAPWSLTDSKVNRREVPGRPLWKRYCLSAQRVGDDGASRTYYWEVMGFDVDQQTVWVNVSTPNPNNVVCQPYVNQPAF